ncbi:AMP-binding protein [Gordonia polyisoprenivorans]|uniref:AMP-binding protein n=1 Tax=Gordonia polyisoprenivorans TaxID=84595 RepID=UPI001AD79422|nr:AMP-binding protein [Gordonia polyisoprenivorans]QTI70927.1 AMP-binding protein [Gordonia polyisoprenivorans]
MSACSYTPGGDPATDPWWYFPADARKRYDLECRSIPNALRLTAQRHPDLEAIVGEDGRRTFAELEQDMIHAVRGVIALGVRPGDRIAVWAPNCARWVTAALGILGAGGVLVPVNTRFKGEEAAYVLRKSGASALFVVADFLGTDYTAMLQAADPELEVLRPARTIVIDGEVRPQQLSWERFLDDGSTVSEADALAAVDVVTPDSLSDIMFTSGTTGHPKGVQLTHGQSLRAHGGYSKLMGFEPGDRYLIVPPFFHTFGYKAGWMACLVHGVTIIPAQVFDTDGVMQVVERERVTILFGPPTIFQSILDSPKRSSYDLSSIRNVMLSSTVVPADLLVRTQEELRPELIHGGYGLTEATSLVSAAIPGADSIEQIATTVGRPALDIEVRIVDDEGRDVATGEPGELLARGYNIMRGYWEEPERTAEAIDSDGWLRTGDIATMDEQRYIRITDRKKDMILVGGFNVYPAEVERILRRHPDVQDIAVVAAPDARLGEVAVAFVVPRPGTGLTEADFLAWSADQIANFKRPRRAILVDALPRNASMKVLKKELRDRAQ